MGRLNGDLTCLNFDVVRTVASVCSYSIRMSCPVSLGSGVGGAVRVTRSPILLPLSLLGIVRVGLSQVCVLPVASRGPHYLQLNQQLTGYRW